jgi:hypothetical protein
MLDRLIDGVEGRRFRSTLQLYLAGIGFVAPVAFVIALSSGIEKSFRLTPVLVLSLVGLLYALRYSRQLFAVDSPWVKNINQELVATRGRILDILFSSLLLTLFAPAFLVVAMLIKRESEGPIFFRRLVVGKDGKVFASWKFRTVFSLLPGEKEPFGPMWKVKDDPRVTRVGRWLRYTALDELPQLLNVLSGDMTLVGPRPAPYSFRGPDACPSAVKPGLAPVSGWFELIEVVLGGRGVIAFCTDMKFRDYELMLESLAGRRKGTNS